MSAARRELLRSIAGLRSRRAAVRRAATAPAPAPFVVGATRSGTTLLRLMLDAHPGIAIPSETHFIPELVAARDRHGAGREQMLELLTAHRRWGDFHVEPEALAERWAEIEPLTGADAVRAFYALYAESRGKPEARWGDKTPGYVKHMREIQDYLPEARFVHLIRDGRDVALSVLKQQWGPQSVEAAAEKWRGRVLRGRSQRPYLGFYIEVSFEDLVLHTERELRRICEFVEIDYDEAMLDYHERAADRLQEKARPLARRKGEAQSAEKRLASHAKTLEPPNPSLIGAWRERMEPDDIAAYEALAGDLLAELGYELDTSPAGEVHRPRRGPRAPRPLRRAVAIAAHLSGRRPPAELRLPAPFLIEAPRSGGELLAAMLDANRDMVVLRDAAFVPKLAELIRNEPMTVERVLKVMAASGPLERYGLSEDAMRRRLEELDELKPSPVLRCFYEAAAAAAGVSRWGDATPSHMKRERRIQRALGEARFVHVVRDGRDTLAAKPGAIDIGTAIATAERWDGKLRTAREGRDVLEHYLEVRYERLVADPASTLREVCDFVELPFEAAMADPPERAAIEAELGPAGGWSERLAPDAVSAFEEVAGAMLDELGYRSAAPARIG